MTAVVEPVLAPPTAVGGGVGVGDAIGDAFGLDRPARPDDLADTEARAVERFLTRIVADCRQRGIALGTARHDVRPEAASLDPADYRELRGLPTWRRRDFALGRQALRAALTDINASSDGRRRVSAGPSGAASRGVVDRYRLPSGFTASVSHSRGFAVAAVVQTGAFRSLGVDIELGTLPDRAAHLVLREEELPLLSDTAVGRPLSLLQLFSAKEAAYKAFSPLVPDLEPVLRDVRLGRVDGVLTAWPAGRPRLRANVRVLSLGTHGVLCWTGVRSKEAGPR